MAIQLTYQCNESWDKMPDANQGKFCDKCSKNIYDLTNKTELEIHQLYLQNKGKLCGKIQNKQLDISLYQQYQLQLAKLCVALFLVFGSCLFNNGIQAQNIKVDSVFVVEDKPTEYFTVKGVVKDKETQELIPFASVYYDTGKEKIGGMTDFDGVFNLKIPRNLIQTDSIIIHISTLGYETIKITGIDASNLEVAMVSLEMKVSAVSITLGMVVIDVCGPPLIDTDPDAHRSVNFYREDIEHSPYR